MKGCAGILLQRGLFFLIYYILIPDSNARRNILPK